jgi:hypothetical protein
MAAKEQLSYFAYPDFRVETARRFQAAQGGGHHGCPD